MRPRLASACPSLPLAWDRAPPLSLPHQRHVCRRRSRSNASFFCHSPRPSMTPNPRARRRYDLDSRPTRPPRHHHHCPRLRRRFLPSPTLLSSSTSSSHHFSPPPSCKTRVFRGLVRRIMCLCVVGCLFLTSVIMCDQSCAICVVNRHFQRGGWPFGVGRLGS